jgi:hypothetical protein
MPEQWIRALMHQESGGNLYRGGRLITSTAGAMGLMQVMPGTYEELRTRHDLGPDPFDPHDNIMAGVAYMREMYDIYGSPGFLAAYNAGPNRLDDYLSNQRGLPEETRQYVAAIAPRLRTASPQIRSPAEQYAINQLPTYIPPGTRYGSATMQASTPTVVSLAQPVQGGRMRPVDVAFTTTSPVGGLASFEPSMRTARAQTTFHARHTTTNRVVYARRQGNGVHLISNAVAAEVNPVRHHQNVRLARVNHEKSATKHQSGSSGSWWTRAAARPVHTAAAACHETHGKRSSCGPLREAKK